MPKQTITVRVYSGISCIWDYQRKYALRTSYDRILKYARKRVAKKITDYDKISIIIEIPIS